METQEEAVASLQQVLQQREVEISLLKERLSQYEQRYGKLELDPNCECKL